MEKSAISLEEQTQAHNKQKILSPFWVGLWLLYLLPVVISFYVFINQHDLQVKLEDQRQDIEDLKTQFGLILGQHRAKRALDESVPDGERNQNDQRNNKRNKKRDNKNRRDKKSKRDRRKKKNRNNKRDKDEKPNAIKAIHMHIDSMRSEPGKPQLLTGPEGSIVNYWKTSDDSFNQNDRFQYNYNGTVTVKQSGLYLMYSQLTYFDRTGRWSHVMDISGQEYIKCLLSEWGVDTDPDTGKLYSTAQQCYTSAVAFIKQGDQVAIKSMYPGRNIHGDQNLSFWGLIHFS